MAWSSKPQDTGPETSKQNNSFERNRKQPKQEDCLLFTGPLPVLLIQQIPKVALICFAVLPWLANCLRDENFTSLGQLVRYSSLVFVVIFFLVNLLLVAVIWLCFGYKSPSSSTTPVYQVWSMSLSVCTLVVGHCMPAIQVRFFYVLPFIHQFVLLSTHSLVNRVFHPVIRMLIIIVFGSVGLLR